MFRQVKSPAYGTGISANLVSDDQRQRYNYGGRVGLETGTELNWKPLGEYLKPAWDWWKEGSKMAWGIPGVYQPGETMGTVDGEEITYPDIYGKAKTEYYQGKAKEAEARRLEEQGRTGAGGEHPLAFKYEDVTEGEAISPSDTRAMKEKEFSGEIDSSPDAKFLPTEDLDIEKPTAYETLMSELDKSAEEKKRLGKGNALMQAAAAAVEWSGAGTAKERSAAISKGLTQVGETAMKAAAEGMDLKDRVKILKTMEDVKGGHKMDVWQSKFDNYYKKALEISGEELDFKKLTAKALNEEIPPEEVYKGYIGKGVLSNPLSKAEILGSLIKRDIPVASDDKEKKQFSSPDNDGLIFIDMKGKIWRNTNGDIKSVDVWQDTEFFGE